VRLIVAAVNVSPYDVDAASTEIERVPDGPAGVRIVHVAIAVDWPAMLDSVCGLVPAVIV